MRRILLALLVLGLSACQSNDPKKLEMKAAELQEFEPTVTLKRLWSKDGGSGQDVRFSRFVPGFDDQGNIYTVGYEGDVYSFTADRGKRRWVNRTRLPASGGVGVSAGGVFFGTYEGELVVLDKDTGEIRWRKSVSSEIAAAPAGDDDVVVVNTIDGRVFAFEIDSGELRWSYDHTTPVLTLRGNASPVLTASQVILAFDNGQILSLSAADGSVQWQVRVSRPQGRTELDRIVDIDGTPVLSGGYLYAGSFQGNIVAISRAAGREMWSEEGSTPNAVAVHDGKVFVSAEDSHIYALNAITGAKLWETADLKRRNTGSPAIIGDYLAVADAEGYVHVLSQESGTMAYRFKPRLAGVGEANLDKYRHFAHKKKPRGIRSPIVSANDKLYVFADSGRLSAYAIDNDK